MKWAAIFDNPAPTKLNLLLSSSGRQHQLCTGIWARAMAGLSKKPLLQLANQVEGNSEMHF